MESMSIGSSITIANSLLCECLHSYKLEYPKRQIQILIENSMILEESIVSNQLDLTLIEGIPTHEHIQKLSFFKDELAVICAREHPLAEKQKLCLQDIAQEPFLLRRRQRYKRNSGFHHEGARYSTASHMGECQHPCTG